VKEEIYDYFYNGWLKVKEEYTINKGIAASPPTSLTAYQS
jgi:hypothetical protein